MSITILLLPAVLLLVNVIQLYAYVRLWRQVNKWEKEAAQAIRTAEAWQKLFESMKGLNAEHEKSLATYKRIVHGEPWAAPPTD